MCDEPALVIPGQVARGPGVSEFVDDGVAKLNWMVGQAFADPHRGAAPGVLMLTEVPVAVAPVAREDDRDWGEGQSGFGVVLDDRVDDRKMCRCDVAADRDTPGAPG